MKPVISIVLLCLLSLNSFARPLYKAERNKLLVYLPAETLDFVESVEVVDIYKYLRGHLLMKDAFYDHRSNKIFIDKSLVNRQGYINFKDLQTYGLLVHEFLHAHQDRVLGHDEFQRQLDHIKILRRQGKDPYFTTWRPGRDFYALNLEQQGASIQRYVVKAESLKRAGSGRRYLKGHRIQFFISEIIKHM